MIFIISPFVKELLGERETLVNYLFRRAQGSIKY
jgi:hypothetical protein